MSAGGPITKNESWGERNFAWIMAVLLFGVLAVVLFLFAVLPGIESSPRTIEHEGHLYLSGAGGGLTHHPDCGCEKGK